MKQPKYTPEEALAKVKLMMKYDLSKTLSEQAIPGGISQQAYDKIMSISATNRKNLQGGYLFPAQQSEINKEFGTDTYTKFYRNGGEALLKSGVAQKAATTTDPWTKFPCVTGSKNAVKTTLTDGTIAYTINKVVYYNNGRKKLSDGKMVNYTCNDPEFKKATQQVEIPKELKDANGVKIFQDWLDVNAAGWATGYKEGIINKGQNGGGYGKFGPRTQKAWNDTYLRERFLSRNSEEMTKMEPTKINQLPTSTNDNVGSDNKVPEVPSEDSMDIINNY